MVYLAPSIKPSSFENVINDVLQSPLEDDVQCPCWLVHWVAKHGVAKQLKHEIAIVVLNVTSCVAYACLLESVPIPRAKDQREWMFLASNAPALGLAFWTVW